MRSILSRIFFIIIGSLILFYTFFVYNAVQHLVNEGYYTSATLVKEEIKTSTDSDGKVSEQKTAIWNLENRDGQLITIKENILLPFKEVGVGYETKVYYDPDHFLEIIPADSYAIRYGMHLFTLMLGIGIIIFAWSDDQSITRFRGNTFAAIMSIITFFASVIASFCSIPLIWMALFKFSEIKDLASIILNVNVLSILLGFMVNLVIASLAVQVFWLSEKDQRPNMFMAILNIATGLTCIHSFYSMTISIAAVFLLIEKLAVTEPKLLLIPFVIALIMTYALAFLAKYYYRQANYYVKENPQDSKNYKL